MVRQNVKERKGPKVMTEDFEPGQVRKRMIIRKLIGGICTCMRVLVCFL